MPSIDEDERNRFALHLLLLSLVLPFKLHGAFLRSLTHTRT